MMREQSRIRHEWLYDRESGGEGASASWYKVISAATCINIMAVNIIDASIDMEHYRFQHQASSITMAQKGMAKAASL